MLEKVNAQCLEDDII